MRISREQSATAAQLALTASFLVASYFLVFDAADYLRDVSAAVYGRFWPVRDWMFLHIAAGALALLAGGVQMYLGLRRRTSTAHRWVGRIYVGAVLASCIASLVVLRHGSVFGPAWVALLAALSACALIFTACGWSAAKRREWPRHTAWMIRSYMAMMVFAWFRLAWELPLLRDTPPSARAATVLALTMLITFAGTELVLWLRPFHRTTGV